jgi:hypothetical protein
VTLVFVDCEASGPCPGWGVCTEFGAVEYIPIDDPRRAGDFGGEDFPRGPVGRTFRGVVYSRDGKVLLNDPVTVWSSFDVWLREVRGAGGAVSMVTDNPAFDWQWVNAGLWGSTGSNVLGHSARRIGDFYAGLTGDFRNTQRWKRLRVTEHDHDPVHDAAGNCEAFDRILRGER